MRILKVTQSYYPFLEKGGPAVKVRAIALGLAEMGHSVSVLTNDSGFCPSMVPGAATKKGGWGWCMEERGVKCIFVPSVLRYRSLSLNPRVLSFCRQTLTAYSIVHIYGLYDLLGPAVASFCRRNQIPYVVEPMGMFRPIVRSIGLKKVYHRTVGKKFLSGAYRLIATSELEQQELVAGGVARERILVRRNGVEAPTTLPARNSFRRKWQIPSESKLVLYLGRLEPKKRPDLLLNAFAEWHKNSSFAGKTVLAICGPGEDRSYQAHLKSIARKLGLDDSVLFPGPLYHEQKWSAYRDADVFVLPSQNENFGNSAAESIACGTPVIVTDQCGIAPFVAGKTGLVVVHSREAIAAALKTVLEDEGEARRFREACPAVLKDLSWSEPVSAMDRLYREALARPVEKA